MKLTHLTLDPQPNTPTLDTLTYLALSNSTQRASWVTAAAWGDQSGTESPGGQEPGTGLSLKPLTIPLGQTHVCSLQGCWSSVPSTQAYSDHSLAPPREPGTYREPVPGREYECKKEVGKANRPPLPHAWQPPRIEIKNQQRE